MFRLKLPACKPVKYKATAVKSKNPKGISTQSPGLRACELPRVTAPKNPPNRNSVATKVKDLLFTIHIHWITPKTHPQTHRGFISSHPARIGNKPTPSNSAPNGRFGPTG